jgi:hypothetical protein
MFAVRNATFRDGHHSFVARLVALNIRFRRASCRGLGEMIRNRWRLFLWCLLGAALLVLASWPLMICWHVRNGVPLIPAAFETLLWPLAALGLGVAARGVWAALADG